MKVKDLLKPLEGVDPETEVIGGAWNGRVDTYKVMDDTWYTEFDNLWSDFYGTPGEMDDRLFHIESENVFYIVSHFTILNKKHLRIRILCGAYVKWLQVKNPMLIKALSCCG